MFLGILIIALMVSIALASAGNKCLRLGVYFGRQKFCGAKRSYFNGGGSHIKGAEPSLTNLQEVSMAYEAKNFDSLIGTDGFSKTLLQNHFKLYQGYVANTNKVTEELESLFKEGKTGSPAYGEISRRFGWEFNGMRLHEYYFGNMIKGGSSRDESSELFKKIGAGFGGFNAWEKDFRGKGGMRGIGWVVLYHDSIGKRLFNVWVNEHDMGHPAGAQPILVMDVFEHAFITDYGLKKAEYIDAFFKAINWKEAAGRFRLA